jgi:hypothetical protein
MRRHTWPVLLWAVSAAFPVFAVADDGGTIRPAKEVTVTLAKGEKKTVHQADAPYISEGIITLFPGDKIMVEFEIAGSVPTNPRVVTKIFHPERTLELEMTQDAQITMVNRKSGFARNLTMDCYFLTVGSDFKNHANLSPLYKGMYCGDGFEASTYCVKLYNFGFEQ